MGKEKVNYTIISFPLQVESLGEHIYNRYVLCHTLPDSQTSKILKIACRIFVCIFPAVGIPPFIQVNMQAGQKLASSLGEPLSKASGIILATCDAAGFGVLNFRAAQKILDDFFHRKPSNPQNKHLNLYKRVFLAGISSSIAGFTLTPGAFLVYNANSNPVMLIFQGLSGFPFISRSAYLGIKHAVEKPQLVSEEQELNRLRKSMIERIEKNREIFASLPPDQRNAYMQKYQEICQADQDSTSGANSFLQLITSLPSEYPVKEHWWQKKSIGSALTTLGVKLALSYLMGFSYYTYVQSSEKLPQGVSVLAAVGTFAALTYSIGGAVVQTSKKAFHAFCEIISGNYTRSLPEQFRSKLTFALKAISLLTAFSWGTAFQAAQSLPEGTQTYGAITMSMACVFLISSEVLEIINELVTSYSIACGSPEEKAIMQLYQNMGALIKDIKESPIKDFAYMIRGLPLPFFNSLVENFAVTHETLNKLLEVNLELSEF